MTFSLGARLAQARRQIDWLSSWPRRWLLFPGILFIGLAVLSAAEISGSSASLAWPDGSSPTIGQARPVRSDEWWVRTPMIVNQEVNGFPRTSEIGMGEHDQGVAVDLPTSHPTILLRPHLWVYHLLPLENAFAFEWWSIFILAALGPYALLWKFTQRAVTSTFLSVAVAASPVIQWWTNSFTGTSIGYLCIALAVLIDSVASTGTRRRIGVGLAGWLLACAAAVPYPAWVIPLCVALIPVGLVALAGDASILAGLRRSSKVLAGVALVAACGALSYALIHRDTFHAITATVYPGGRNESGGTGDLTRLLSAPYNWFVVNRRTSPANVLGTNISEASGPLFLILPASLIYCGSRLVANINTNWRLVTASLFSSFVLVTWFLAPIPARFGSIIGLNQVPPNRLLHTFAPLGAVSFGLALVAVENLPKFQRRLIAGPVAMAVFITCAAAGARFTVDSGHIPTTWVIVISLFVASCCYIATVGRHRLGTAGLAVFLLMSGVLVNPVQRGLDSLVATPLVSAIRDIPLDQSERWVSIVDDSRVIASLVASGVNTVNGASVYPDKRTWLLIDPDSSEVDTWNRYAHIFVEPLPKGSPTQIKLIQADVIEIDLDLCGDDARKLSIKLAILDSSDQVPACGRMIGTSPGPSGVLNFVSLDQN